VERKEGHYPLRMGDDGKKRKKTGRPSRNMEEGKKLAGRSLTGLQRRGDGVKKIMDGTPIGKEERDSEIACDRGGEEGKKGFQRGDFQKGKSHEGLQGPCRGK